MPETLTPSQIDFYRECGYLVIEGRIPSDTIAAIRSEIARFQDTARNMTESDERIDLEDSHTPESPRIRRVKLPHTQSEVIDGLMRSDHVLAPVRDLIGPLDLVPRSSGTRIGRSIPTPTTMCWPSA